MFISVWVDGLSPVGDSFFRFHSKESNCTLESPPIPSSKDKKEGEMMLDWQIF